MGISSTDGIIPMGVWGDAAPYHTRDSLFLLLVSPLSVRDRSRMWVCAFSKRMVCCCGCRGRCTFEGCFKILAWSFTALACGVWPKVLYLCIMSFSSFTDKWVSSVNHNFWCASQNLFLQFILRTRRDAQEGERRWHALWCF